MNIEKNAGKSPPLETDLRQKPLLVPWTWGEYYAVRYLAGTLRMKLDDLGARALRRGLQEIARETIAEHTRTGKPVPQRLAALAIDASKPSSPS